MMTAANLPVPFHTIQSQIRTAVPVEVTDEEIQAAFGAFLARCKMAKIARL
jgi:hypothetical protein